MIFSHSKRIYFEEQSGVPHRAYHVSAISFPKESRKDYNPRLSIRLEQPRFNMRALWRREKDDIRLFMKNGHDQYVKSVVSLYLPYGLKTDRSYRYYELPPGQERVEKVPLILDRVDIRNRTYHMVVSYEAYGVHYSEQVEGEVQVQERPVIFRTFTFISIAVLLLLFTGIYLHGRKARNSCPGS